MRSNGVRTTLITLQADQMIEELWFGTWKSWLKTLPKNQATRYPYKQFYIVHPLRAQISSKRRMLEHRKLSPFVLLAIQQPPHLAAEPIDPFPLICLPSLLNYNAHQFRNNSKFKCPIAKSTTPVRLPSLRLVQRISGLPAPALHRKIIQAHLQA